MPTVTKYASWRDVFCHEWRNTDDEGLAGYLYASIAGAKPMEREVLATAENAAWMGGACGGALCAMAGLFGSLALGLHDIAGPLLLVGTAVGAAVGAPIGACVSKARALVHARACATNHDLLKRGEAMAKSALIAQRRHPLKVDDAVWVHPDEGGEPLRMTPNQYRREVPWWKKRPSLGLLFEAMADPSAPEWAHRVVAPIEEFGPDALRASALDLYSDDVDARYRAAYVLYVHGTEAIPLILAALDEAKTRKQLATRLVEAIAARSRRDYAYRHNHCFCPHCMTRFEKRSVRLSPLRAVDYYACRSCGSTRGAVQHTGKVVAVLDGNDREVVRADGDVLRVNWLARAKAGVANTLDLFDFDSVDVVSASDEDLRRFLVDVANDTDEDRRKRYRTMPVRLSEGCAPEASTLHALRAEFPRLMTASEAEPEVEVLRTRSERSDGGEEVVLEPPSLGAEVED